MTRAAEERLLDAVPDLVTSSLFAAAWLFPLLAPGLARTLVLVMLVEFVLIHATGAYHAIRAVGGSPRFQRNMALVMAAVYGLFIVGSAVAFGEWWPLPVFGWLVWSKTRRSGPAVEERWSREVVLWGASFVAYVLGATLTGALPLPRLGLDADAVARLELPGGGSWVEEPHTIMAFGMLYFGTLAWVRTRRLAFRLPAPFPR